MIIDLSKSREEYYKLPGVTEILRRIACLSSDPELKQKSERIQQGIEAGKDPSTFPKITNSDLDIQYEPAGQTFVTNRVGDAVAAERDLGFKWAVDLEEGLRRLIEWRKSHITAKEKQRREAN